MLSHARRRASRILAAPFVAGTCLFGAGDARAQSTDTLPSAVEPWLAEPGDRSAAFNQAQIACFQGSMGACDAIWLDDRVLLDSLLGRYGRTCGGRVDLRAIRRANVTCAAAFPGHD